MRIGGRAQHLRIQKEAGRTKLDHLQFLELFTGFQETPTRPRPVTGYPPLLNLAPEAFLAELLDHYLFAALHEMFYTSLTAENHQRMEHLQRALDRLEQQAAELGLKCNTLRQEEITEEIEVILLSAEALYQP